MDVDNVCAGGQNNGQQFKEASHHHREAIFSMRRMEHCNWNTTIQQYNNNLSLTIDRQREREGEIILFIQFNRDLGSAMKTLRQHIDTLSRHLALSICVMLADRHVT